MGQHAEAEVAHGFYFWGSGMLAVDRFIVL